MRGWITRITRSPGKGITSEPKSFQKVHKSNMNKLMYIIERVRYLFLMNKLSERELALFVKLVRRKWLMNMKE